MPLKILPKSQREKRRYIRFELGDISKEDFLKAFEKTFLFVFGLKIYNQVRPVLVKEKYKKDERYTSLIIKTTTKGLDYVRATFALMQPFASVQIRSLQSSGTVKGCKKLCKT